VSRFAESAVRLYGAAARILPLHREPFRSLYNVAYFAYKRFEDPLAPLLEREPQLLAGGHAIDAGANIGYTTLLIASHLREPFVVHAFEPEPMNARLLARNVRKVKSRVVIHSAAVGSRSGRAQLELNPGHPGDHRIATRSVANTIDIEMVTIDEVVGDEPVSFLKLDVQGFELEASRGMTRVLDRNRRITVVFEFAPFALIALGYEPAELIAFYRERDFELSIVDRGGIRALAEIGGNDYVNILCRR
jgi:FkbM family methyltransferase